MSRRTLPILLALLLTGGSASAETDSLTIQGVVLVNFKLGEVVQDKSPIALTDLSQISTCNILESFGCDSGFKVAPSFVAADTNSTNYNGDAIRLYDMSRWYVMAISDTCDIETVLEALTAQSDIDTAIQARLLRPSTLPDDPRLYNGLQQWNLRNTSYPGKDIHAEGAWDYNTGRADVTVGIIDTGVDYNHPDLDPGDRSRVLPGIDFGETDADPMDTGEHGTDVAGIVGAITDNGFEMAGVMWDCTILPLKARGPLVPFWHLILPWAVTDAINYASSVGTEVINMSIDSVVDGVPVFSLKDPLVMACYNAYMRGAVLGSV